MAKCKTAKRKTPKCKTPLDEKRLNQVVKWVLTGATEHDVVDAIKQAWPEDDAVPLITAAIDRLRAAGDFDHQIVLGWCFEATRDMYRRMVDIGDFPGALRAIKQLAELSRHKPR